MELTRFVKAFNRNNVANPNRLLRKVCIAQMKQIKLKKAVKNPKTFRSINSNPFFYILPL